MNAQDGKRFGVTMIDKSIVLTVGEENGEQERFEVDYDGAIELAASFFFAALCMPQADPDKISRRFADLLNQKGQELRTARATFDAKLAIRAQKKGRPS